MVQTLGCCNFQPDYSLALAEARGKIGLALAGVSVPRVHAGENNTIQLALIGCGGRGTGAAANADLGDQGQDHLRGILKIRVDDDNCISACII